MATYHSPIVTVALGDEYCLISLRKGAEAARGPSADHRLASRYFQDAAALSARRMEQADKTGTTKWVATDILRAAVELSIRCDSGWLIKNPGKGDTFPAPPVWSE